MPDTGRWNGVRRWALIITTVAVFALVWGYLLSYFKPELLLLDTMDAGGDTPSFHRPIKHLKEVLLPAGNPLGWDLGNFAGYAPYQFYFLPPSLLMILLDLVIPFNIAFRLVTVAGTFLLPLSSFLATRAMGRHAERGARRPWLVFGLGVGVYQLAVFK